MPVESSYLAAFLVGLFGGVHCVGMCGGIVGALTLGLPESLRNQPRSMLPYLLAYNSGRLTSYTLAGVVMGSAGALAIGLTDVHRAQQVLQALAGLFMLALGLYLAGWWQGLLRVERAGGALWRKLEPLGRRFMPVTTRTQAYLLGLVWGWLPCGLVYSVLIWTLSAGGSVQGGLLMLSFGLGTLPTLLAMGLFATRLAVLVRQPWARRVAGLLVMAFGAWMLLRLLAFIPDL